MQKNLNLNITRSFSATASGLTNRTDGDISEVNKGLMNMSNIGIVGAGQMGTGIGIVSSRVAELNVTFLEPGEENRHKSKSTVENWIQKEISKERLTE